MHIRAVDWRIESLHNIVIAIDAGLAAVRAHDLDGITAMEHSESLLGLGFVAFQNYVLGAWTDLNHVRKDSGKPPVTKLDCYKCDPIAAAAGATRIEAINATANYVKHNEEWSQWPLNETTRILKRMGITQATEFPCVEVTRIFCGDGWRLIVLHQVVREWREHIFNALG